MPIMNRCCCCDVRSGTFVVAIWTMIAAAGSLIASVRAWANLPDGYIEITGSHLTAYYVITIIVQAGIELGAVCLVFGAIKYKKELLLPYLVAQGLAIFVDIILVIILIVVVANGNISMFNFLDITVDVTDPDVIQAYRIAYGIVAAALAVSVLIALLCFFCVVSFFQQLRDGCHDGTLLSVNQDCQPIMSPQQKQGYYTSC
ncbi:uncharacterized protein LOC119744274 [Patiria miniata]|uniref:Uncharacterized protein n=1 Tax=Patiria miniata TaxID=46514 RepID=A0A914BJS9_PATMI|nr:uncharacterized protein LOC119744274 [Patiria miniata]